MNIMQPLKAEPLHAVVRNGRLVLDEPTDLPEGEIVGLVPVEMPLDDATDYLDDEERAQLRQELELSIDEMERGETVDAEVVLAELRASR